MQRYKRFSIAMLIKLFLKFFCCFIQQGKYCPTKVIPLYRYLEIKETLHVVQGDRESEYSTPPPCGRRELLHRKRSPSP